MKQSRLIIFVTSETRKSTHNGAILAIFTILKTMSSAAESKVGATYVNAKERVPICVALEELGHLQTTLETDT
jgi:hypothetical protein